VTRQLSVSTSSPHPWCWKLAGQDFSEIVR
jgi:hypothetical protein